jgi:hypothetical protein
MAAEMSESVGNLISINVEKVKVSLGSGTRRVRLARLYSEILLKYRKTYTT